MACMRVLQTNNLTYAEPCTICPGRQVKILSLWQVSFSFALSASKLFPFVTSPLFHSLPFTHRFELSIPNAWIQNQRLARFPLSLLLAFYRLWPQSVLLSPPFSTCSSLLLFHSCLLCFSSPTCPSHLILIPLSSLYSPPFCHILHLFFSVFSSPFD